MRSSHFAATRPRSGGFTLIELMIAVAIVGILAAIAYPSYQEQVRKGRRADAMAQLVTLAQGYERFYTSNNTYVGFWDTVPAAQRNSPTTGTAYYELTRADDRTSFTITATPLAAGNQSSDRCGKLTINQAGSKRTIDATAATNECWR
jgi:type IV pilus assembly protein PilE